MKRRFIALFVILCTLAGVMGFAIACKPEETPKVSGNEAGAYYCDHDGAEYTLDLGEECKFTLKIASETMAGEYVLENETLTLNVSSGDPIAATYRNDTVTLSHRDVTYTFLRKVEYTFKFDTDGGSSIADTKVVNGRLAAKPADPTKEDKVFVGWYTDNTYLNPYYFSQPVTEDTTVYARFVEKLEPEFTVKFDANYAGADPIDPVTTVGNALYFGMLPVPERTGYEFVGWYVSQFQSAEKLSYAYSEQKIVEDLTLYAVWDDGAPVVSVNESGVEMSAKGTNRSYSLTITAPDGSVVTDSKALANGATTKFAYAFADKAAGEYKAEVTVDGKTTTRFFNNKALARVSVFKIENSTLIFNEVANATKYTVSVVCGTDGHVHNDIPLDDKTAYNFESCDMRPEGITFVVKAYADGYVTSTSAVYTYINHLSQVQNITYDDQTHEVSWGAVEHATSYAVTVKLDGEVVVNNVNVGNVTSYSVKTLDSGEVEVRVTALAHGWNSSEVNIAQFTKEALAAPKNVQFNGDRITWDAVKGAKSYRVTIGDRTEETSTNYYEMKAEDFGSGKALEVTVYAVGETAASESFASDSVTLRNDGKVEKVTYKAGRAVWDYVYGATAYEIKIGSGEARRVNTPGADVKFTSAGDQTIYVRAIFGNTPSADDDWATTTVRVYSVDFVMGTSEIPGVDSLYLAAGDAIDLPTPEWVGYDYQGWYTAPGGVSGEGLKYDSTRFNGGNLKLYASFTPRVFTITLVAGDMGEWQEQTFEVTYRQTDFVLPVPTSNSVEYTFQGWYRGVGGTGSIFADLNGGNTGTYTLLKDLTLYARWTTPFVYQKVQGGYSISLSSDGSSSNLTEITLPDKHLNEKVVTVEDLTAGKKLQIINIPNTVETISLGSVGKAFSGLSALKEVNIYSIEDNRDPKYASEGGMVYEVDGNRLVYVPIAIGADVTLPENIQVIVAGAIYLNTSITNLTIPASVYEVQADAIHGNTNSKLEEIKFIPSEDANATLTIADAAFASTNTLKTIEIPKYTEEFSSAKLKSCLGFANVNVADAEPGDRYFSIDGVLCRTTELDGKANVREIIYYPVGKADTSYEIPAGITSIGDSAFASATKLKSLTISAAVTHIGVSAFDSCTGITSIEFKGDENSNDLTIGDKAFLSTKPTSLTIPANVVKVGFRAFYISSLTSITLLGKPNMHVSYSESAFQSVAAALKIGKDFPVIDLAGVFSSKTSETSTTVTAAKLTGIDISENSNYAKVEDEKAPGYGAIFDADMSRLLYIQDKVADFVIPEGITQISSAIFAGNKSLKSVTISSTVSTVSDFAFQGCTVLETVSFAAPEAGKDRAPLTIGNAAFYGCTALTNIKLPAETTEIGTEVFRNCSFTEFTIPGKVKDVGANCFYGCDDMLTLTVEEGVESIGDQALYNASKLQTVTFPKSLTFIGLSVFEGCKALKEINVVEGNNYYKSIEGALYAQKERNGTPGTYDPVTLLALPVLCEGDNGTLHIPETVTEVAGASTNGAGANNTGIVHLEFADEVVDYDDTGARIRGTLNLGVRAFSVGTSTVSKLETVKLPVGLTVLSDRAFNACKALTEINIPYTVTEIGASVFYQCEKLVELKFDETPAGVERVPLVLGGSAFSGMIGITEVVLPERTTSIGDSVFNSDSALQTVTLPSTIEEIPANAFSRLTLLEEVILPETFDHEVKIGYGAFSGCTSLKRIGTLKQVVVDPEENLTEEVYFLPEGIVEIGYQSFNQTAITSIGLPSTLATLNIGDPTSSNYAFFQNCSALKTVVFADDCALDWLPGGFVTGASSLEHVVFGANSHITMMGKKSPATPWGAAFAGAARLKKLTIPASVETIDQEGFSNLAGLEKVTFEEGSHLTSIGDKAFTGTGLTSFAFPTVKNEAGEVVEITVGADVFNGCASLAEMDLSASIWNISGLFNGCPALTTITADKDSSYFVVDDSIKTVFGLNADGDRDTLLYVYGEVEGRVVVPEGTLEIAEGAYRGQTSITELVLSSTVVTIGESAFENCLGLEKVSIIVPQGGSSALSLIDTSAFMNCWNLSSFDFAAARNLSYIGETAFYGCGFTKLDLSKNVMLGSNAAGTKLNGIGEGAFSCNYKLGTEFINPEAAEADRQSVMLPDEIKILDSAAFRYDTALTRIDLSNTKITVLYGNNNSEYGIFSGCTALKEVKLPLCLKSIEGRVFSNSGLEKINLEELVNLTSIGPNAFLNTQLTEIVLPEATLNVSSGAGLFRDNSKLVRADLSKVKGSSSLFVNCTSMFANCPLLTEVKLPSMITSIGDSWFSGCTSLAEIEIPEGVTSIGESAFADCSSLQHIDFPAALKTISNPSSLTSTSGAFKGTSLKEVDLSGTEVTVIGGNTFRDVATITSVKLPETLTTIGNYAFSGTSITSIEIPENYKLTNASTFRGCALLTEVKLKGSDYALGNYTFQDCVSLTDIDFTKISSVGQYVFRNTGLTSVTLYSGVKYDSAAFMDCLALEDVTISDGVTSLPGNIFSGCENLAHVNIPAGIETIGNYAFSDCVKLSNVEWPSSLSSLSSLGTGAFSNTAITAIDFSTATMSAFSTIANQTFMDCTALERVVLPENIIKIGNKTFQGCTSLTQIVMNGVTEIGTNAFDTTAFETITIGPRVTSIGNFAFSGCESLKSITVSPDNEKYVAGKNGALYERDPKKLLVYPLAATKLELDDDVKDIATNAFSGYHYTENGGVFTLPSSVTKLSDNAFTGITLEKFIVEHDLESVGNMVFQEAAIKEFEFKASGAAINNKTSLFKNNTVLTKVTFPAKDFTTIGSSFFEGCTSLTSFEIPKTVTTINGNAFKNTGITEITVPSTVTKFGGASFAQMPLLEKVTINAKITVSGNTGTNAFAYNPVLTTVSFGKDSVQYIGSSWFIDCTSLKTIESWPENLKEIGMNAFRRTAFEEIELPESVTVISDYCFDSCASLKHFKMPEGVQKVSSYLFQNCTSLEWVYLGENITEIGGSAFNGCTSLKFVNMPELVTKITSFCKEASQLHLFIPSGWASFGTGQFWYPTETNHIYFADSMYDVVASRGLTWLTGGTAQAVNFGSNMSVIELNGNVHFNATFEQALEASGVTDFPGQND